MGSVTQWKLSLSDKWLLANCDCDAQITSFSQCICFGDPTGSGYNTLCVVDFETFFRIDTLSTSTKANTSIKLKVIAGMTVKHEIRLVDLPCGICTFNVLLGDKLIQDLAVASGPNLYVYRNLKPYFKFKLPLLELCAEEEDAWRRADKGDICPDELFKELENLHRNSAQLTVRSLKFLQLKPTEGYSFFETYRTVPLKRQTTATCMTKMYRHQSSPDAVQCLVVGTEDGALYVIDPITFNVLTKYTLPAVSVHLCANGSFDVDYRIVVSCRNGVIYQIKRGTPTISDGINPGSQIVGLVRLEKSIVVGCMDQTIKGFSLKGNPIWSVRAPSPILTIVPINLSTHSFHGYIVSLKDGDVRVYQEQHICDTVFHWTEVKPDHQTLPNRGTVDSGDVHDQHTSINDVANGDVEPPEKLSQNEPSVPVGTNRLNRMSKCDPVIAAQFGPFDREAGSLALITQSGALCLLLVKRSAQFRPLDVISRHPTAQTVRLELPKKTQLFLDLADREKKHAPEIYDRYNHDLVLLRCTVAKAFLELLQTRSGPLAVHGTKNHLKLTARVYGLGPNYTLAYELIETQADENWCSMNMGIFLDFDDTVYQVTAPYIPIPMMVPNVTYKYETSVRIINDNQRSDTLKVHVIAPPESKPLVSVNVKMPLNDASLASINSP